MYIPYLHAFFLTFLGLDDVDKEGVEPEDLDFLEMDRRVSTLAEIAHFVRCIPFSSDRNSEIWNSPNSVTIMKKGNPLDHALLMVNYNTALQFPKDVSRHVFLWLARQKLMRTSRGFRKRKKPRNLISQKVSSRKTSQPSQRSLILISELLFALALIN